MQLRTKRLRKGLTLIESALAMSIAVGVTASVMVFYSNTSTNNKTHQVIGQLGMTVKTVRTNFAGSASYEEVDTQALINTRQFPKKMVNGTSLRHAFGGDLSVESASYQGNDHTAFIVNFAAIPSAACSKLTAMEMGTGLISLSVNETEVSLPAKPSETTALCNQSDISTLAYKFR